MIVLGLMYLLLQDFVLSDFSFSGDRSAKKPNSLIGRTLVGIQIGLTGLSIYVTHSSVLSLQAKQGLPAGNQIVGWIVLGKLNLFVP